MTRRQTLDFTGDASWEDGVKETERFIDEVLEFQDSFKQRVYPVITPRFIPSCTDESFKGGWGKFGGAKYGVHVQTHCSESDWEHQLVKERYGVNDAQALNRFGLLTDKTVLAHAVFSGGWRM